MIKEKDVLIVISEMKCYIEKSCFLSNQNKSSCESVVEDKVLVWLDKTEVIMHSLWYSARKCHGMSDTRQKPTLFFQSKKKGNFIKSATQSLALTDWRCEWQWQKMESFVRALAKSLITFLLFWKELSDV